MSDPKELNDVLPVPTGYRILIAIPEKEQKSEGGILLPGEMLQREQTASIVGYVMKVGPDAYKDEKRFPNGPYCKEGDFILFKSYAGVRFKIKGQEFRVIHDDTVDGVVPDPTLLERI